MPFPGMLHSPSSFEVSKPSLAGISRCEQENSSTPGELSSRSHYLISCCLHSAPGIPVSIGLGSTKTLAKLANRLAKRSVEAQGVVALITPREIEAVLARTPIEHLWGIGPGYTRRLKAHEILTAL